MARKHLARTGASTLAVALVLSLGVAAGTAYAYYTDTQHAQGMISFSYTPDTPDTPEDPDTPTTEVDEYPVDGQKIVTVKNTGTVDAMVRVKLFYPDFPEGAGVTIAPEFTGEATSWTQEVVGRDDKGDPVSNSEGWFYWPYPLAPGQATPAFTVKATLTQGSTFNQPFDIVVVQQCASARDFNEKEGLLGTFADGPKFLAAAAASDDAASDGAASNSVASGDAASQEASPEGSASKDGE